MKETAPTPLDHGAQALSQALGVSFRILRALMGVVLVLYFLSGLYQVQQHERAYVLKLGKLEEGPGRVKGPGFHITLPRPFAEVVRVPTERTRTVNSDTFWHPELNIDPSLAEPQRPAGPGDPFGYTLTGDANVLHTRWALRYQIADAETFAFAVQDPDAILRQELDHAVIKTSGRMLIDQALRTGMETFRTGVETELNRRVQELGLGVQIIRVDRVGGAPPPSVRQAFAKVIQAEQDRSQQMSKARAQAQRILNEARGNVSRVHSEARAYRTRLVDEVRADADYFTKLKTQFARNPVVLYRTLLQDTLRRTLSQVEEKFTIPKDETGNQQIRIRLAGRLSAPGKKVTMQTNSHAPGPACGEHHEHHQAESLLLWIFIGTAFVLNAFVAKWVYADNPMVGDISAMIGALLLALPIFRTALKDLVRGKLRMNELVALAVLAAMVQGDYKTAGLVAFFMLLAEVIETRTAEGAHASIEELVRLTPTTACRLTGTGEEKIPVTELNPGDRIRVLPGDTVPADGAIVSGLTTLNEATITGESLPVDKGPDQDVFAGTNNLTGAIEVTVNRTGEDTTLGQVRELILAAEKTKLPIMLIIDKYIAYYTPVVLMLAGMIWFFTDDWNRVISLLVISCPCALILATPTAMVAALSAAARLGILVKNVNDLEAAGRIDAMVLDKTGTLTTGILGVGRLAPREGVSPSELLQTAASAEQLSNHPTALALQRLAGEVELTLSRPEGLQEQAGQGIEATVDGDTVLAGRAGWLQAQGIKDSLLTEADASETGSYSAVFIAREGRYLGWIGLEDQVRPEAKATISELRELNIRRIAMVSGDRHAVAEAVAHRIGCREFKAECLPQEKVDFVHAVQRDGHRVAVVGDGVNDAPALAAGDTGIVMGAAGSDVAIHSASVALMSNDIQRLPALVRLSRSARRVILQNLGVGIVFIVGGLILSGLGKLNPVVAAFLHNVGSLVVVFNSARLIREGEEIEASGHAEQETRSVAEAVLTQQAS